MQIFARLMALLWQEAHGVTRLLELLDVAFGGDAPLSRCNHNLSPLDA